MKQFIAAALVAAVGSFALVGCGTGTPGGPGTGKSTVGTADNTFSLDVPNLETEFKQGESKVVEIGINRGKNFGEDVSLKFEGLPKGVTADPASPDIKAGDKTAKVTLKAAADAALGEHKIKVIGHPKTGTDASNEFQIEVKQK